MNWKKGLGLFVMLVALIGALWLSRSSLDPTGTPPPDVDTAATPHETADEPRGAPPGRPWEGIKPPRIAGPPVFPPKTAPQDLQVEWHGSWYAAEILSSGASSNLIRYKGYGPEWDEWISAERMRFVPPGTIPPEMATSTEGNVLDLGGVKFQPAATLPQPINEFVVHGSPAKGELLVQWGSGWWPAEVLESQGTNHLIRYKGYGAEWDEWVSSGRMGLYEGDQP
jgi:hypothetical protein